MYRQSYSNLYVASITAEQHYRTCGYWFIVTNGATSHTAFETRAGLDRWMSERGLRLENELAEAGTHSVSRILGEYRTESHGVHLSEDYAEGMGPGDFYTLRPIMATAEMSNGSYTLALITEDYGIRTVHHLNPNVRDRVVFDRLATAKIMR